MTDSSPTSATNPPRKLKLVKSKYIVPLIWRSGHEIEEPAPRRCRGPDLKPRKVAARSAASPHKVAASTVKASEDAQLGILVDVLDDARAFVDEVVASAPSTATVRPQPRQPQLDPIQHFDSYTTDVSNNDTPFQIVDDRTWAAARYHPTTEMHPVRAVAFACDDVDHVTDVGF